MSIKQMIEVAAAAVEAKISPTAKKLAHDLLAVLQQPDPTACWAPTTDAASVHLPREANRSYSPAQARALGVALLRAADKAEDYKPVRVERMDVVLR